MARYIDADEVLRKLPDDLPYKASAKRVLMQAPEANVAPIADTVRKMQSEIKKYYSQPKYLPTPRHPIRHTTIDLLFVVVDQIAKEMLEETNETV